MEGAGVTIKAVVFDIGGVLEITPPMGVTEKWEHRLGLAPGELDEKLGPVASAGGVGAITEQEVHRCIGDILGLDRAAVNALMADMWAEYLGTLNTGLAAYFASLRPARRTGIISNSFVGARERERERYGFDQMTDVIIYSHEVGLSKPDPRIYQLACELLEVTPEQMIFVDDMPQNVEAADALGIEGVLFTSTAQAIAAVDSLLTTAKPSP
jgi:epoxide hydrolase-like predicted phosphatase